MRSALIFSLLLLPFSAFAAGKIYNVSVDGMTCDACVKSVTKALSNVPNVDPASVKVVLKEKTATVNVKNDDPAAVDAIKKAVEKVGYKVTAVNSGEGAKKTN